MRHKYSYQVNKFKPLQLIMLAVAMLIDLVLVFLIPSLFFERKLIFVFIAVIIFNLFFKISTIYLTYTVEYCYYRKKLVVLKRYYRKNIILIELEKDEILSIDKNIQNNDTKRIVNNYNCLYNEYCINTNKGNFIVNLDDVMYTALTCEDEYDLFR